MSATLTVTRKATTPVLEIHRGPFDIVADGVRVGSVEDQQTFEAPVDPGRHALQVRTGRWSSRTATFDAGEGDAVAFRCHGRRLWPVLLASVLVPNLALKLVRE